MDTYLIMVIDDKGEEILFAEMTDRGAFAAVVVVAGKYEKRQPLSSAAQIYVKKAD